LERGALVSGYIRVKGRSFWKEYLGWIYTKDPSALLFRTSIVQRRT